MKATVPILLTVGILLLLAALFDSSKVEEFHQNLVEVDLSRAQEDDVKTPEKEVFRLAIAPIYSPQNTLERYFRLTQVLAKALGKEGVLMPGRSYEDVNALLLKGGCDAAIICTYPYLKYSRLGKIEAVATPVVGGQAFYQAKVIVSTSSGLQSIADCQNKSLGIVGYHSSSGWAFPAARLIEGGHDPYQFFSNVLSAGSHERSLQAFFKSQVDMVAVHGTVLEEYLKNHPHQEENLKVIEESKDWGNPPVVVPSQTPKAFKAKLLGLLLSLSDLPGGKEALSEAGLDGFISFDPQNYLAVDEQVGPFLESGRATVQP